MSRTVVVGLSLWGAGLLFAWCLARAAALGDRQHEAAHVDAWSAQVWAELDREASP